MVYNIDRSFEEKITFIIIFIPFVSVFAEICDTLTDSQTSDTFC